ncbi:metallophosphoesterase [Salinicoccus sesuvii]|uniref:Metallophosphoesterase n=1 Tax=Salinicoccus sesuvii TaxID=868281 RepID=A0ABV7N246_9STAP
MKFSHIALGFSIALARFLYKQDKDITTTYHTHESLRVPEAFDGYKIIQISDFHNAWFGFRSSKLIREIRKIDGDVIFVTGDVIDRRTPNFKRSMGLISQLVDILPTYYVTGNHEAHYRGFDRLERAIDASGMKNISRSNERLNAGNDHIRLVGMEDLWFYGTDGDHQVVDDFKEDLEHRLENRPDRFTIVLSHRPELFDVYTSFPIDIVFTGHAHGGQIRLPVVKGLYAPHQGVLPKYTEGVHKENDTSMVVSRGLGNSRFPFRVFNRPEIIVMELKRQQGVQ